MSQITVEFEFELGELVYFKDANHTSDSRPQQFVIYERVASQWHGGVQRFYRLVDVKTVVPEIVLTRQEPPYRPPSQEQIDSQIRIKQAMIAVEAEAWDALKKRDAV